MAWKCYWVTPRDIVLREAEMAEMDAVLNALSSRCAAFLKNVLDAARNFCFLILLLLSLSLSFSFSLYLS